MVMLADEELMGKTPKENKSKVYEEISHLGYYNDSYGIKRYGIIPTKNEENYGWLS
jgi:hypothetical protein